MLTRIITSVVALAVFFAVVFAPPIVVPIALAVIIYMMLFECYNATRATVTMRIAGFLSASLLMLAGGAFVTGYDFHTTAKICAIAALAVIVINMILIVILHGRRDYKDVLSNAFLTVYITVCTSCILLTREYFGRAYMLVIFISAWSCDTFAYFTGKFFGRHKLIEHISPNKTVEGAIGGVIGAVITCMVYFFIRDKFAPLNINWALIGALTGLTGGVISQLGDLVASSVKRDANVKDFGFIFPGHGGFLDRFDSVLLNAPFILGVFMLSHTIFA